MFNLKEICKQKEHIRPRTLFDYMVRYFTASDSLVLWSIFNTNYMPSDVVYYLSEYEWFAFISTNKVNFPLPLITQHQFTLTDILTAHIYNNYSRYEFLPKISLLFTFDDFTTSDLHILRDIIDSTVANVLYTNAERYEKLFKANTLEFNPLWNVDGTETTTRTLERDGTETTRRTGTTADAKTGTETTATDTSDVLERTGTDTNRKSGTENTAKTGTTADAKTGTETTKYTGTDKNVKTGQETKEIATDKTAFNSSTMTPTETVTETTQYDNVTDTETKDLTDTLTHNTTDTVTHNTTDNTTYNITDTETLDTQDARTIENNETTTHNTTNTVTHNTTDALTLDTIDTERIEHVRQGNIGVTSATKLLTEYVDFANYFNFIDTICHDIVSELCYMTL